MLPIIAMYPDAAPWTTAAMDLLPNNNSQGFKGPEMMEVRQCG